MGAVANPIFSMDISSLTVGYAWLGIICYSLQIYFDFSGYSDMAIGIGRMLGFTIPENFNRPYYSQSFTEHWTRWHITLGNFFREYLYIPLGGNRAGTLKTYRNLWIVFHRLRASGTAPTGPTSPGVFTTASSFSSTACC